MDSTDTAVTNPDDFQRLADCWDRPLSRTANKLVTVHAVVALRVWFLIAFVASVLHVASLVFAPQEAAHPDLGAKYLLVYVTAALLAYVLCQEAMPASHPEYRLVISLGANIMVANEVRMWAPVSRWIADAVDRQIDPAWRPRHSNHDTRHCSDLVVHWSASRQALHGYLAGRLLLSSIYLLVLAATLAAEHFGPIDWLRYATAIGSCLFLIITRPSFKHYKETLLLAAMKWVFANGQDPRLPRDLAPLLSLFENEESESA